MTAVAAVTITLLLRVSFEVRVFRPETSKWSLATSLADCLGHSSSLWIQTVQPFVEVTWPFQAVLLDEIPFKMTPNRIPPTHLHLPLPASSPSENRYLQSSICSVPQESLALDFANMSQGHCVLQTPDSTRQDL